MPSIRRLRRRDSTAKSVRCDDHAAAHLPAASGAPEAAAGISGAPRRVQPGCADAASRAVRCRGAGAAPLVYKRCLSPRAHPPAWNVVWWRPRRISANVSSLEQRGLGNAGLAGSPRKGSRAYPVQSVTVMCARGRVGRAEQRDFCGGCCSVSWFAGDQGGPGEKRARAVFIGGARRSNPACADAQRLKQSFVHQFFPRPDR